MRTKTHAEPGRVPAVIINDVLYRSSLKGLLEFLCVKPTSPTEKGFSRVAPQLEQDARAHGGMSTCAPFHGLTSAVSPCPSAQRGEVQCSVAGPAGAAHPVRGLLETFEAGPGCAARERGSKETHVIAVGRVTSSPDNRVKSSCPEENNRVRQRLSVCDVQRKLELLLQVTVLLKPLSLSPSPLRALHLLLSSTLPVSWWLEAERLPPDFPVLVQVSPNSSVQSRALRLHVHTVHLLPFRPRALHRWALKHHGNLSSLTHATRGNRVYIRQGEDPVLPAVCHLQSVFLSPNYLASDLQPQEVQGCVHTEAAGIGPEVHVIKLHSAGSGLCGSLQVEVTVSLVPPVADATAQKVVLILSSAVPVNWAVAAHGVRGHISVHSSNSVSPPYPPEPDLTLSSTLDSDLSAAPDLLVWASESGHTKVTSYTEADLANRFVIQLAGGGTDVLAVTNPLVVRPPWAEERRLRQWLNGGGRGRESFTVQCEDGRLSVTVDQHILQFSCLASVPSTSGPTADNVDEENTPQAGLVPWAPGYPGPDPGVSDLPTPRHRSGPMLILRLFVTENYELRRIGPCVITAGHRVYVECVLFISVSLTVVLQISAKGPLPDAVELKSCVVSPLSDPKKSPFWTVISEGCSSDPSLTLSAGAKDDEEEEAAGDGEREEMESSERGAVHHGDVSLRHIDDGRRREAPVREDQRSTSTAAEEEMQPLRFSFILRPVHNDSVQFLHCSLHMCVSDAAREEPEKELVQNDCQGGLRIPPLVSKSPKHQFVCLNRIKCQHYVESYCMGKCMLSDCQRCLDERLPPHRATLYNVLQLGGTE
ncbi:hypothetical protein F2P81_014633 [Scophthalmus maximus]|uniref:TGFBR3/Endoglin-like N-terminal domain-containing protein n=1 Tax=Scophthalmus maximus TaxID=52904 RepID=A0A6A4SDV7_SCOMX|nr:hypothetical protein F2P81_014633 [Scophthalmus maximus]